MPHDEPVSISVTRQGHSCLSSDPLVTVLWIRGEQDAATRAHLSVAIAEHADLDTVDVVVDLSGVTFMDASTVGTLVVARNRMRSRSRSLSVRDPSPRSRRLLELCGVTSIIVDRPASATSSVAAALATWVDVPVLGRRPGAAQPVTEEVPAVEPCHATQRRLAPAPSLRQRRTPP